MPLPGKVPERDARPTRAVVKYADREEPVADVAKLPDGHAVWSGRLRRALVAFDVLECGHEVECSREPGGRILRAHAEPCGECAGV